MPVIRNIIFVALLITLSGCFLVDERNRQKVSTELGKSSWPVLSGTYGTSQNKDIIIKKSIDEYGNRNYVDDRGNFYYVYKQNDGKYIIETVFAEKTALPAYIYAELYDTRTFARFSSDCKDLSKSQRKHIFGNEKIGRCLISNKRELVFLLNKALEAKPGVTAMYKLKEEMADAY